MTATQSPTTGRSSLSQRREQLAAQDRRAARGSPQRESCSALPRRCARAPMRARAARAARQRNRRSRVRLSVDKLRSSASADGGNYAGFAATTLVRTVRKPTALCHNTRPRGVAQPGRALRSGRRGRRFKSYHPDQFPLRNQSPRSTRATPALCVSFVRDFCVTAWGTITRSTVWRCSQTLLAASMSLAMSGAL